MSDVNEVPGWDELLTNDVDYGSSLSAKESERVGEAANNVAGSILDGLQAVGELQWRAAHNKEFPIEKENIFALGVFQITLMDLLTKLRLIESNANFQWHELEMAGAKRGQTNDRRS